MGKDDEHVLAGLLRSDRVDKELVDLGVVHVKVSSEDSPEDSLKGGHPGSVDCSRHKLEVVAVGSPASNSAFVRMEVGRSSVEQRSGPFVVVKRGSDLSLSSFSL